MGEITQISANQVSDEEAFLFAMQIAGASAVPMVLKSALELGIIETIAKAGPGAYLSPYQIVSQLPMIKNPDAPAVLDRLLRLLASFNILTCSLRELPDGKAERRYGLSPFAKYFVNNEDGVSMVASFLMQHDKVLKDMWYAISLFLNSLFFLLLLLFLVLIYISCGYINDSEV